jgi:hypothetical protein
MTEDSRFKFTDDDIREILRVENIETINCIYDLCQKLYEEELKRVGLLEDKAKNLLSGVGVILGLVFSAGALTIEKIRNIPLPFIGCPRPYLSVLYIFLSFTLVICGIFAYRSIIVRKDWKTFSEADIFRKDVVREGEGFYKRFMITHVWKVYKNNFFVNEDKACWLKWGQRLFVGCLCVLFVMVVIIGFYAYRV